MSRTVGAVSDDLFGEDCHAEVKWLVATRKAMKSALLWAAARKD
jgi:hypothetical protein